MKSWSKFFNIWKFRILYYGTLMLGIFKFRFLILKMEYQHPAYDPQIIFVKARQLYKKARRKYRWLRREFKATFFQEWERRRDFFLKGDPVRSRFLLLIICSFWETLGSSKWTITQIILRCSPNKRRLATCLLIQITRLLPILNFGIGIIRIWDWWSLENSMRTTIVGELVMTMVGPVAGPKNSQLSNLKNRSKIELMSGASWKWNTKILTIGRAWVRRGSMINHSRSGEGGRIQNYSGPSSNPSIPSRTWS